jgi:hypothetical protein
LIDDFGNLKLSPTIYISKTDITNSVEGWLMKPPICRVCGKNFSADDEGDLIYFKKRPKDIEWDEMMKREPGMVGHPPYADWFCNKHFTKAKELEHLTIDKAIVILKKTKI